MEKSRGTVTITVEEYDEILKLKDNYVLREDRDVIIDTYKDELKEKNEEIERLKDNYAYRLTELSGFYPVRVYYCKDDIRSVMNKSINKFKECIAYSSIFKLLKLRNQYKKEVKHD